MNIYVCPYTSRAAGGVIIPSDLGRGGSHPLPPRGVIIPSYLGRCSSHPSLPRTSHPPLPLHTQWLKIYAPEHPLPTYTMAKMRVCQGSARGEGVGASGQGSAGLPAQMHQQSRGHEPMYVKSHLPGPRGGPVYLHHRNTMHDLPLCHFGLTGLIRTPGRY